MGIELGFETVSAGAVDSNGKLIGPVRDYRPERRQPDAFVRCVEKLVRELLVQFDRDLIMGVGIGYADRASWNSAAVFAREQTQEKGNSMVASLSQTLEWPVLSRCDAACAALGELRFGQLRQIENGLFLLYEDGIGLGIVAGGQGIYGAWNDAGEIGHLPLDDEGEYCQCGNIGCLETVASQWALLRKAKQISEASGYCHAASDSKLRDRPPRLDERKPASCPSSRRRGGHRRLFLCRSEAKADHIGAEKSRPLSVRGSARLGLNSAILPRLVHHSHHLTSTWDRLNLKWWT